MIVEVKYSVKYNVKSTKISWNTHMKVGALYSGPVEKCPTCLQHILNKEDFRPFVTIWIARECDL